MKILRFIALLFSCLFMISAITGVRRSGLSGGEVTVFYHTNASRTLAVAFSLFFGIWFWTLKYKTIVGRRITSGIFLAMIAGSFFGALCALFYENPILVRALLAVAEIATALVTYWLWQKSLQAIRKYEEGLAENERQ